MINKSFRTLALALCASSLAMSHVALAEDAPGIVVEAGKVSIGYEEFTLPNGLRTIVYTDRSAPEVFVGVWYGVGAANEPVGKTGFAHLFEHLMFESTEHRKGDYYEQLNEVGASWTNGTTNQDRTNYFQAVPTGALDLALWLESDRMGYLLGGITQQSLDEQRGVVQNEKRLGMDRPYSAAYYQSLEAIYPAGHPYRHPTIGSMDDLNAASVEDVKEWFQTYYGASNAVLVLAGDIDLATARQKVAAYFGDMPVGKPLHTLTEWVPEIPAGRRDESYDSVAQTLVSRTWTIPSLSNGDTTLLNVAAKALAGNPHSILHRRLVDELDLALYVNASVSRGRVASQFDISAYLKEGIDPDAVYRIIDDEIAKFIANGPDESWLANYKLKNRMELLNRFEDTPVVGLEMGEAAIATGNPTAFLDFFHLAQSASVADIKNAAGKWLTRNPYEAIVRPFPSLSQAAPLVDRTQPPKAEIAFGTPIFPVVKPYKLANGIEVYVAPTDKSGLAQVMIDLGYGFKSEREGERLLSNLVTATMTSGTSSKSKTQLQDAMDATAIDLEIRMMDYFSGATFTSLTDQLQPALNLAAEVIFEPSFPAEELEKVKTQYIESDKMIDADPSYTVNTLLPRAVYGDATPFERLYVAKDIERFTREDLERFHKREIDPSRMRIVITGDVNEATVQTMLSRAFGMRTGNGLEPQAMPALAAVQKSPKIWLVDKPDAEQSAVYAVIPVGKFDLATAPTLGIMNEVLGGGTLGRLGANLREEKGWSYGYGSQFQTHPSDDQYLTIGGSVQTDKTVPAMKEVLAELRSFVGERQVTDAELATRIAQAKSRVASVTASKSSVQSSISYSLRFGLPYNNRAADIARYDAITLDQVRAAAETHIDPDALTWLIIGDLAKIEHEVRALGYGPVSVLDSDGNVVR